MRLPHKDVNVPWCGIASCSQQQVYVGAWIARYIAVTSSILNMLWATQTALFLDCATHASEAHCDLLCNTTIISEKKRV